ncbi:PD-(D/E)XK nuclease family protein, partial [bacterium]
MEHDLGLLDRLLAAPEGESAGLARFLLGENAHLGRALRARAERWNKKRWYASDGFVADDPASAVSLAAHQLSARSFSPTALQNFSACPYRFYLQALVRLSPREEPEPAYELDPLQRGSLVHQIQFELLLELREKGMLPLHAGSAAEAERLLEATVQRVAASKEDELAPAIPRVWADQIAELRADVREWFRRLVQEPTFKPAFFELAFGLPDHGEERDPRSQDAPVVLDNGIQLRGSIDLVEKSSDHVYRATDYKTGKVRAKRGDVIKGGAILQPVLYALVLEKLLAEDGRPANVHGGQLSYCTYAGGFEDVLVELNDDARKAADQLAVALKGALETGFLPALPREGECKYCDYRSVCGPYEEVRTGQKPGNKPEKRVGKPLA